MLVLARREPSLEPPVYREHTLLLEGSWSDSIVSGEQNSCALDSLDDTIDRRHDWIDAEGSRLAHEWGLAGGESSLVWRYALELRYYIAKLLRVVAYFGQVRRPSRGASFEWRLTRGRDEDYAALAGELARAFRFNSMVTWQTGSPGAARAFPPNASWRRLAGRLLAGRRPSSPVPGTATLHEQSPSAPRVLFCGQPRLLDPVCQATIERGAQVAWLYERFSVGCWRRWRRAGIPQFIAEHPKALSGGATTWDFRECRIVGPWNVDLAPALASWWKRLAADVGSRQAGIDRGVAECMDEFRPTALVLDEDATPFKRTALAAARHAGARSLVVQHGAPVVSFGFAPLAADRLLAWDNPSRDQLSRWGIDSERVQIVGWPESFQIRPLPRKTLTKGCRRILLLATIPPADDRPDAVDFHLTSRTYAGMIRLALAAAIAFDADLTIKPHPRASGHKKLSTLLSERPTARVRVTRSRDLPRLIRDHDLILSCASTAGTQAARAGAPVIQLLPDGSGEILPAAEWGFLGTARTLDELLPLVQIRSPPESRTSPRETASAERIAELAIACPDSRPLLVYQTAAP